MFSRQVNESSRLCLTVPQFADDLFALTQRNREYLQAWLPWVDKVKTPQDTRDFIIGQLSKFVLSEALHTCVFYDGLLAGALAYNCIDLQNRSGHIGYWLGQDFQGKGIMTECVKDLIRVGQDYYQLERFEIRCAAKNARSRAIPERLGFEMEGTIRRAERVHDHWYDHIVYGKLVA